MYKSGLGNLLANIPPVFKAFPVLCRILSELKLLDTNVGIVTLAAGVANDVVGEFSYQKRQ